MTDSSKRERVRRTPAYRTYYFYPPFDGEPIAVIIPEDQVGFTGGHFTKLYRRYESRNWKIQEIKPKEKTHEKRELHPQTGQPV